MKIKVTECANQAHNLCGHTEHDTSSARVGVHDNVVIFRASAMLAEVVPGTHGKGVKYK